MALNYLSEMGMDGQQRDSFMRNAYISIMSFPDQAVTNRKIKKELKIIALKNILGYFESLEEYEKCGDLLEIIRRVENE